MKINIKAWIVTCAAVCTAALPPLSAQTQVDLRTQTKSADLSSVGPTKPAQTGSILPLTCSQGQIFFLTTAPPGTNIMACTSTNQWTASGGGALEVGVNGASAGIATILNLIPGTYVTQTIACAGGGMCSYQPDVDTTRIPANAAIQAGQLLAVISSSSSGTTYTGVMAANDPLAAYAANQQLIWNVGSTPCAGGAMTLNIDGLGAIPLKLADGVSNLVPAQCAANAQLPITYDAVNTVFRGQSAPVSSGINSITGDGTLISNSSSSGSVTITLGNAGAHTWFGNNTATTGAPGYNALTPADIPTLNQSTTGAAGSLSGGTTGQIYTSTNGFIDFPDVKIIPFANCISGTAGGSASTASTSFTAACRAGSGNLGGADQGIPSSGASLQFMLELPGDWDPGSQPYINVYFGSGSNTSGTVIWTASSACIDLSTNGGASDDPSFNAEPSFATGTMAAANRMWYTGGHVTAMTNANGCKPHSPVIVKLALTGTAASNINAYQAVVTIPRLPVVEAN